MEDYCPGSRAFLYVHYIRAIWSHEHFDVASSGTALWKTYYPLKDIFESMPTLLKQVILYVTTPFLLNFATIDTLHFINEVFLRGQFSPFDHQSYEIYR